MPTGRGAFKCFDGSDSQLGKGGAEEKQTGNEVHGTTVWAVAWELTFFVGVITPPGGVKCDGTGVRGNTSRRPSTPRQALGEMAAAKRAQGMKFELMFVHDQRSASGK